MASTAQDDLAVRESQHRVKRWVAHTRVDPHGKPGLDRRLNDLRYVRKAASLDLRLQKGKHVDDGHGSTRVKNNELKHLLQAHHMRHPAADLVDDGRDALRHSAVLDLEPKDVHCGDDRTQLDRIRKITEVQAEQRSGVASEVDVLCVHVEGLDAHGLARKISELWGGGVLRLVTGRDTEGEQTRTREPDPAV